MRRVGLILIFLALSLPAGLYFTTGYHTAAGKGQPKVDQSHDTGARSAANRLALDESRSFKTPSKFLHAKELADQGQLVRAETIFRELLKSDPENVAILRELSLIELFDRRNPEQAIPYLTKLIKVTSIDLLLLEVFDLFIQSKDYTSGYRFFQLLSDKNPAHQVSSIITGQFLYLQGHFQKAISQIKPQLANQEFEGLARSLQARSMMKLGQLSKGLRQYNQSEQFLEAKIKTALIKGHSPELLIRWLEDLQRDVAQELILRDQFKRAEDVLYKLSAKIPLDPGVIKMMDLAKSRKHPANAG